ncbi:MAG: hypothetical protein AAB660_02295 [Patescibacteria group bacterium]
MSITEEFHFDKEGNVLPTGWRGGFRRYFLTVVIILVATFSFGVGRLTGEKREGVSINYDSSLFENTKAPVQATVGEGSVVASSQGTKYYYSNCRNTISEKNKVTFATAVMAESAGYTLAANCKAK